MEDKSPFSQFNLSPPLLRAIADMGFEEPTPIQSLAIPVILSGKDVTGQAQTGTGKTAAFGIPALEAVDPSLRAPQVIILSPTRELAIQTAEELALLAAYKKKITILPVYGGQPIERQIKVAKKGIHVVVGTPGRVRDHLARGTISLSKVTMVVLDEADQMLDMGFREEIEAILRHTPRDRQTVLFSATLPAPILEISRNFQRHPEFVRVPDRQLTVPQIEQQYLEVRAKDKLEILSRILDLYNPDRALVFCNTKSGVDELTGHLQNRGYLAEGLHGDKKQETRNQVMGNFRKGMIDVLVATDVASRGIDVENIDLVINYDVPQDVEYYVHRIGRTARAGRSGRAITFASPREIYKLRAIQRYARIKIARIPHPEESEVRESKIRKITETITRTIDEGGIEGCVEVVERMMMADYTSLDIAAALLKLRIGDQ